jgi:hypothetical protein
MALEIDPKIQDELSSMVKTSLSKLSLEQQSIFVDAYKRKRKDKTLMIILSIFFPIQLFLLGKTGLGVAFLLTAGGLWIWWLIEIFMTAKRVNEFNEDLATTVMRDLKIMNA